MIERLRNAMVPLRSVRVGDTGYRRLLRWAALPVTDRRWAAPLCAVALGFGLFVGVAIGPGAAGTLATGVPQIVEISGREESGGGSEGEVEGEEPVGEAPLAGGEGGAGGEEAFAPLLAGEESLLEGPEEEVPSSLGSAPEEEDEPPAEPEKPKLTGTVVHVNPAAGSYTVVEPGGVMSAVHAGKLPKAGTQIEVPIETLANGTLAEAGKRIASGKRSLASLAGIVTAVDTTPSAPAYAVSNRGTSVLVRVHPDSSGAAPSLPALGAYASVAVEIETPTEATPAEAIPTGETAPSPAQTCVPDPALPLPAVEPGSVLWQRQLSTGGAPFTHSDFAGIVTAVCPDTAQLLISADDVREGGRDLLFAVPPDIDLSEAEVGQSVLVGADIGADGSLSLTGLASDEHRKGADDAQATQGDLVPEKPKGKG